MSDYIIVMTTAPSKCAAAEMAEKLVSEKLAACVNIIPEVRSIYMWKGKVCDEQEVVCILKTRGELFDKLKARIIELHPYDLPEVVATDITDASEAYLRWIDEVTG